MVSIPHIGEYHILQGVDFDVPRGELFVLLGRNGAGKSTCLRTIMGLWRASQGQISLPRPTNSTTRDARHRPLGNSFMSQKT